MKVLRLLLSGALVVSVLIGNISVCFADNPNSPRTGQITGKTVLGGVLSLLVWPGIGQAINSSPGDKVATHAIIGLLPPYRFWSGYDALVDRKGGYWKGRI